MWTLKCPTDYQTAMAEKDEEEWDTYVVHDGKGVSHVLRMPKGKLPQVRCVGCDD